MSNNQKKTESRYTQRVFTENKIKLLTHTKITNYLINENKQNRMNMFNF